MKHFAMVVAVLLFAVAAAAQTDTLYVTDGDANRLAIVQGGTLLATKPIQHGGYPIAVSTSAWIGRLYDTATAVEYDLAGNPTGNSVPITEVTAVDGATDGTRSWQLGNAFSTNSTVYESATRDFQNPQSIFNVSGSDLVGITYDPVNGTLWIKDQSNVYQYSLAGSLLSQFAHIANRGPIAYEQSTDTLWLVQNGSNNIYQYSKSGTLLQTVTVAGLASNNWGAEFNFVPAPPPPVPLFSFPTAAAVAMMLLVVGFFAARP